jgi:hypothetical protein
MMEMDWTKESPKVKEAYDHVIAAYAVHKTMNEDEKQRLDYLMDMLNQEEGEKDGDKTA